MKVALISIRRLISSSEEKAISRNLLPMQSVVSEELERGCSLPSQILRKKHIALKEKMWSVWMSYWKIRLPKKMICGLGAFSPVPSHFKKVLGHCSILRVFNLSQQFVDEKLHGALQIDEIRSGQCSSQAADGA